MKNTFLTIAAVFAIIAGFFALVVIGNKFSEHQQVEAEFGHLRGAQITLEDMNEYADRMGKPHMERLPWIDEQGRNIYEFRQSELERLGLEAYIEQYVKPYEEQMAKEEAERMAQNSN